MLATLLIAADLAGSIAVSGRTEARVRAPGTASATASFDLETAPALEVMLASRRLRVALTYAPRLTLWDVGASSVRPTLLHGAAARVEWTSRLTRLSLDQAGSYGGVSLASAALPPGQDGAPPRAQLVPLPQIIQIASSTTTLASRLTLRRWTVDMMAGYRIEGGADAGSRAVLPFQTGPNGRVTVSWAASRRDHLETSATASEASFSSGPESLLVEVAEGFRHLWSRVTETRFTLGVSEARVRASASLPHTFTTHPVAEGVLDHHPTAEGRFGVRLGVRLGPVVDRLIGLVDDRVEGSLAASHTHRRLATRAFVSASQSVPAKGVNVTSLFTGELGAAYGAGRHVVFDVGLRGLWQRHEMTRASFLQGIFFAGVAFRAPPMRL